MTGTNNLDVSKKLSDNLQTKINNVNAKWNKTKQEYKHDIVDIYQTAISEGYSATNAAKLCREKIDIFSDRTIMRTLPENATRSYNKPNLTNVKINNQRRLVVPEEPTIPPPRQVLREAEIVREPPKPINEPIPIPQRDTEIIKGVIFDPAPIDRDRTQVFIMDIDPIAKKVMKYKTVGRRTIR